MIFRYSMGQGRFFKTIYGANSINYDRRFAIL